MATGFRNASGVDFDDVFDPYVQGTKPAATGFRTSDGVDLNQRYAPLSWGSAAPVQGIRLVSGADVNTLWAKKGTAVYDHVLSDPNFGLMNSALILGGAPGTISANCSFLILTDGTWQIHPFTSANAGSTRSGNWYSTTQAGIGSDYDVMLTYTVTRADTGSVHSFNAAAWTRLSTNLGGSLSISAASQAAAGSGKTQTGSLRVQIRDATTLAVLSDQSIGCSVSLNAAT